MRDWLIQSRRSREIAAASLPEVSTQAISENTNKNTAQCPPVKGEQLSKKKLNYKDQRELDQLPNLITALETEQQAIQQALADRTPYSSDSARAAALHAREGEIANTLMAALDRWQELSA